jgi:hypothetical protein
MILGTYMVYYFYWREIADVMAPVGDGKYVEVEMSVPLSVVRDATRVEKEEVIAAQNSLLVLMDRV